MFVDNTKKIICLSVPGTDTEFATNFLKQQFNDNSISVNWFAPTKIADLFTEQQIKDNAENTNADISINLSNYQKNLQELLNDGLITSPISEYEVYGLCRDPFTRLFRTYTAKKSSSYEIAHKDDGITKTEVLLPENIKLGIIRETRRDFYEIGVDNIFAQKSSMIKRYYQQVHWLKHEGQVINKIYKYSNYTTFVSDICAKYNVNFSLYDDQPRIECTNFPLVVDDLFLELQEKIIAYYSEDKALYDSL